PNNNISNNDNNNNNNNNHYSSSANAMVLNNEMPSSLTSSSLQDKNAIKPDNFSHNLPPILPSPIWFDERKYPSDQLEPFKSFDKSKYPLLDANSSSFASILQLSQSSTQNSA